jgi:hypothetical protein
MYLGGAFKLEAIEVVLRESDRDFTESEAAWLRAFREQAQ